MYKLAGKVLDFLDDSEGQILLASVPQIEKAAGGLDGEVASREELDRLPNDSFALVFLGPEGQTYRKYAMHDKLHTAISTAYLGTCGSQMPPEAQKLAAYHLLRSHIRFRMNPPSELLAMPKEASMTNLLALEDLQEPDLEGELEKDAAFIPDHEFLLVKVGEEERERFYRVASEKQCRDGLERFEDEYRVLEPADRVKVAMGLKDRAEHYGISAVGTAIEKYSAEGYNPGFRSHLALRAQVLPEDSPHLKILETLESKQADTDALSMAISLEAFDKEAGLEHHWDKTIPDPYASVLGPSSEKIQVGSRSVSLQEIRKVASDEGKLSKIFGEEKIAAFRADPEQTFFGLPTPIQEALLSLG
jgi:hypothetical protein